MINKYINLSQLKTLFITIFLIYGLGIIYFSLFIQGISVKGFTLVDKVIHFYCIFFMDFFFTFFVQ